MRIKGERGDTNENPRKIGKSRMAFIDVREVEGNKYVLLANRGERAREESPSCHEVEREREREKSRAGTYKCCVIAVAARLVRAGTWCVARSE